MYKLCNHVELYLNSNIEMNLENKNNFKLFVFNNSSYIFGVWHPFHEILNYTYRHTEAQLKDVGVYTNFIIKEKLILNFVLRPEKDRRY